MSPIEKTSAKVIVLAPVRHRAATVRDAVPAERCGTCGAPGGSTDECRAIDIVFDLASLPSSSDILFAGIELSGLQTEPSSSEDSSCMSVRANGEAIDDAQGSDSPQLERSGAHELVAWHARSKRLQRGGRKTIEFDSRARAVLGRLLGCGDIVVTIAGTLAEQSTAAVGAEGQWAPRLRLAYVAADDKARDDAAVIRWDTGGG